jgi:hypothetical protein
LKARRLLYSPTSRVLLEYISDLNLQFDFVLLA